MTQPQPVVIDGVGVIGPDGRWYPQDQLRKAVQLVSKICDLFDSLPTEVQDFVRWEAGR